MHITYKDVVDVLSAITSEVIAVDTSDSTARLNIANIIVNFFEGHLDTPPDIDLIKVDKLTQNIEPVAHIHSWRVEGDDNYELYHNVCEDCGATQTDDKIFSD